MLSPYDLWLVKKWPDDVETYVNKFWYWALPCTYDGQIYRSDADFLDKYHGSKIVIIGGGPSTNDYLEDQFLFDYYPYTWSCNNYFKNQFLKNCRVDLAMIMPGIDTRSKEFLDRIDRDCPDIGIELHDRWFQSEKLKELRCRYSEAHMFFSHTRFFGKLGVGARMLILAASLGVKEVSFIGFDGPVKGHSFEEGKFELPSQVSPEEAWKVYKYQYDELYDHLAKYYPFTSVKSIDKTNRLHEKVW